MGVQFPPHAVGESIGGIDEDEVEAGAPAARRRALASQRDDVGADQLGALAKPQPLDVAERRPGVAVDQDGVGGAAREGLDRQRAGAAVEVEDAGAGDRRRAPRRSPRGRGRRSAEPSSRAARPGLRPPSSPAITRIDSPLALSCPSSDAPSRGVKLEIAATIFSKGIGSAAPAPKRRRAASSSGPSWPARRASRGGAAARRPRSRAATSSGVSSGSSATAKRGRPCWRVPRISPSPRRPSRPRRA